MSAPEHPEAVIHFTDDMTEAQYAIFQARCEETAARARAQAALPSPAVLLAACEAMAMLIRDEYGDGPIAPFVRAFTSATAVQIASVGQVEAYWAATGKAAA